jgi:hypothetical protein
MLEYRMQEYWMLEFLPPVLLPARFAKVRFYHLTAARERQRGVKTESHMLVHFN